MNAAEQVAQALALQPIAPTRFIGRYRGFLTTLTLLGATNETRYHVPQGLMVHVRFRGAGSNENGAQLAWNPQLAQLATSKIGAASRDRGDAWLEIYDLSTLGGDQRLHDLVVSFFDDLETARLRGHDDLCVSCERAVADQPGVENGQFTQTCAACRVKHAAERRAERFGRAGAIPRAAAYALLAVPLSAAAWAGAWIAYALVMEWLLAGKPSGRLLVPEILMFAAAFAMAIIVGGPVAYAAGKAEGIGGIPYGVVASVGILLSILLGEVAFSQWIAWRATGSVALSAWYPLLMLVWQASTAHDWLLRAGFTVASVTFGPACVKSMLKKDAAKRRATM